MQRAQSRALVLEFSGAFIVAPRARPVSNGTPAPARQDVCATLHYDVTNPPAWETLN